MIKEKAEEGTELTVLRTSLFLAGDGFCVYDCTGTLVFRVDSYGYDVRDRDELVLMDASGKCLLTVKRKRPSLHQRWEGFAGERNEGQKPIFSVRRSSMIGRSGVTVKMYRDPGEVFVIDGSFSQRSCIFCNGSRKTVAEIKKKVVASSNVVLGKDVFSLLVKPGVDAVLILGLVLILDHIDGQEEVESN